LKQKNSQYVPYVKYVIAPDTRFERDAAIFFDRKGDVSQGRTLINYGWNQTGFKEIVEAFYVSEKGSVSGFDRYFEENVHNCVGNIVEVLRRDRLIDDRLRGLVRIDLRQNMAIPALLVEIQRMMYKYCTKPRPCLRLWSVMGIPDKMKAFLDQHDLTSKYVSKFRCTRQFCYKECGSYKQCVHMYTSTEDLPEMEAKIQECALELVKQIETRSSGSPRYQCRPWTSNDHKIKQIGRLKPDSKCFERPVRLDLKPLRYYILDPATWEDIEKQRYDRNPRNQFDAFPVSLLPYIFDDRFLESTELSAPLRAPGILESFLQLADIKFEIRYHLERKCHLCASIHKITGVPIKAMFKKDDVFRHEAGFAELLWDALLEHYPGQMCKSFRGLGQILCEKSPVLRRETKVREFAKSPYGACAYDFSVDLSKLVPAQNDIFAFDLTTALWKKSGFHEEARPPEDHLNIWRETLCRIPNTLPNMIATWYIVRNETEDTFFDETAPNSVKNMDQLVDLVSDQFPGTAIVLRQPGDLSALGIKTYKLLVVPVFNSTPAKGEARHELTRIMTRNYPQLLIKQVVDFLPTRVST